MSEDVPTSANVNLVKRVGGDGSRIEVIAQDLTRKQAIRMLTGLKGMGCDLAEYDLTSVETGRFVSWVLDDRKSLRS